VEALDRRPDVLFDDPVELEGLARGHSDGFAAVRLGELVDLQPLLRCADAARETNTHHEGERRLELLASSLVADVAVVLLVNAVELHELVALEGHSAGNLVEEVGRDLPAQVIALELQRFVRTEPVQGLRQVGASIDGLCHLLLQYTSRW
jgi:hypothetical protein